VIGENDEAFAIAAASVRDAVDEAVGLFPVRAEGAKPKIVGNRVRFIPSDGELAVEVYGDSDPNLGPKLSTMIVGLLTDAFAGDSGGEGP
jgi:hypothetical protein